MNNSIFNTLLMISSLVGASVIYFFMLPEFIKDGGYLIIILIMLSIMVVGYSIERFLIFHQWIGYEHSRDTYVKKIFRNELSVFPIAFQMWTNWLRSNKFRTVESFQLTLTDIQTQLEKNLSTISTIASISTMIGLLGTTIGMIRAFTALSHGGAPDAVQLSLGISEALINTAGGLIVAIMAIIAFNIFSSRTDQFLRKIKSETIAHLSEEMSKEIPIRE